ncbi:hypothetical protein PW5551_01295 [Petrotoga sp. 9PW.55.5.1]|uniref:glycerol-3-phosphate responsive antiterminator n=1 Tax=Petrotoga sp. 9PW.55.5.1 TaxID=1308979 RepID=UPI000DC24BFB|nr:glycerol-3-phosphate responsive antiterminator [Petrotoga sp. 9PW.55.5.1]RAO99865.1 hypothetical protein PW5551_01295 [Petrotoga sp. 9PW.55.5.1]
MISLKDLIVENTIIPAVRNLNDFEDALKAKSPVIFLLTGSLLDLENIMLQVKKSKKVLMINVDLLEGIASDKKSVEFLATKKLCNGIISTKNNVIRSAMKENLLAIQRVFLIDSGSLKSIKSFIEKSSLPDAFEILPAIAAPYFIENIRTDVPIIAGGLINKKEDVINLFEKGAKAISSSTKELWQIP